MSTAIRVLIGLGLFVFGLQLGRAIGRTEPLAEELRALKRRRGITIEGEKVEPEPRETAV
jgi:hypothetical protein